MKLLIVGGGGREHAIAVSMKKSRKRSTVHREMPVSERVPNVWTSV